MEETFRLDLNQSWEATDIKTGHAVLIPKGSHQAIRIPHKSPPDQTEENYLVVAVHGKSGPMLAGLREAYWRQWEGHYIELRVTAAKLKKNNITPENNAHDLSAPRCSKRYPELHERYDERMHEKGLSQSRLIKPKCVVQFREALVAPSSWLLDKS